MRTFNVIMCLVFVCDANAVDNPEFCKPARLCYIATEKPENQCHEKCSAQWFDCIKVSCGNKFDNFDCIIACTKTSTCCYRHCNGGLC
jgi:hypothetical protein